MTENVARLAERVGELRRDFDRAFAEPPALEQSAGKDLLAIRLGGQDFALRLSEISGLFADKSITCVPGAADFLLGIAGFRGALAPVYDLSRIFGHERRLSPRWLVLASTAPVAFAFDGFGGQMRVSPVAITPAQHDQKPALAGAVVDAGGLLRPIIELEKVLELLHARQ